jgi:hypothetical protein
VIELFQQFKQGNSKVGEDNNLSKKKKKNFENNVPRIEKTKKKLFIRLKIINMNVAI